MSPKEAEATTNVIEDTSAALYAAEKAAINDLDDAVMKLAESESREDNGETKAAFLAQEAEMAAHDQSNEFGQAHTDELHEAALKEQAVREAAEQVAAAYEAGEGEAPKL